MCTHCEARSKFLREAGAEMSRLLEETDKVSEVFHSFDLLEDDGTPHSERVDDLDDVDRAEIAQHIDAFETLLCRIAGYMAATYASVNQDTASHAMAKWADSMARAELLNALMGGATIIDLRGLFGDGQDN